MKTMKTRTGPKFLVKQTKASRELNLAFQGPISRLFNLKRVKIEKWFSNLIHHTKSLYRDILQQQQIHKITLLLMIE